MLLIVNIYLFMFMVFSLDFSLYSNKEYPWICPFCLQFIFCLVWENFIRGWYINIFLCRAYTAKWYVCLCSCVCVCVCGCNIFLTKAMLFMEL